MARSCVFCGKNKVTKEHLFAKWVRDAYDSHESRNLQVLELKRGDAVKWSYKGNSLEQGVNAFCAGCNNGWMSSLETKAAAIMRPMLRAESVGIKMQFTAQATVASWAVKTAMVLQQLYPADDHIPTSEYRDFHRKQQPSSNVFVTMGARHIAADNEGRANLFEHKGRFVGSDSEGIQHIHFAVGALYFGITMFVGKRRPRSPRHQISDEAAMRTNLIWPVQAIAIWPTPSISDIGGVEGMYNAFASASWRY